MQREINLEISIDKDEFKKKLDIKDGKDADEAKIVKKILDELPIPKDGYSPVKGKDYFDGTDGSPDSPEEIREKLKTLKGKERLPATAISGLSELTEKVDTMNQVGYASGGANQLVLKSNGNRISDYVTELDFGSGISTAYSAGKVTVSGASQTNPGGSNSSVQFNDSGIFGGDATFQYNKTTKDLYVGSVSSILPGTISRSGNYVSSVVLTGGKTLTISRSGNYISSIGDGTKTWSFTRTNNLISSWSVS